MIASFRDKKLQLFFETGNPKGLSVQNTKRLLKMLQALDAAAYPSAMDLPGYWFHAHINETPTKYSCRLTGNWRLFFRWVDGHAAGVELGDPH
jgi:proteic killer suppression protein